MQVVLAKPALLLADAARKFGDRMDAPVAQFRNSLRLACEYVSAPSPTSPHKLALDAELTIIDDVLDALPSSDILYNHINAVSIASAALSSVSTDDPHDSLAHIALEANPPIKALRAMNHSSHTLLADAVAHFLQALTKVMHSNVTEPIAESDPADSTLTPLTSDNSATTSTSTRNTSQHTAPHLVNYSLFITNSVQPFVLAALAIGSPAAQHAQNLCSALNAVYDFLVIASQKPEPSKPAEKQLLLEPIIKFMRIASETAAEINTSHPQFNHIKAMEEAISMVSWIAVTESPITCVSEADSSASFYANKILMTTKSRSDAAAHKAFVTTFKTIFSSLKLYIKEFFIIGVRYNIGISAHAPATHQPLSSVPKSDGDTGETNYVTAFNALITGSLQEFLKASKILKGEVEDQSVAFAAAWKAEADFLAKALCTPKPDDFQEMLKPIVTEMRKLSSIAEKCDPRGPFANHCQAVSESVAALGWIAVEEKAVSFVGDSADAGQFYLTKVKMGAKATYNPKAHRTWASALETLYKELKAYVKEYHTQKLVWNPSTKSKVASRSALASGAAGEKSGAKTGSNYVVAFGALMSGPLAKFLESSKTLGGEVDKLAKMSAEAWEAEKDFLSKAMKMAMPADVQGMLSPLATKMGEVNSFAAEADARGPFGPHCNAVAEYVAALGWVAVEEKATSYVGDMSAAGGFFSQKVKFGAKKTDNPEAHRRWATSLEELFKELKLYVKEHHTQRLTWNKM